MRVGLFGTGYAAKLRAQALLKDRRTDLTMVVGNVPSQTEAFARDFQCSSVSSQQLIEQEDIDLVIISNVNSEHGAIARAALKANKHVVVEYPLCLDLAEASDLINLAKSQNKLLHVEHIELLGGLHNCLKQHLDKVGEVFYVRYSTIKPEKPAPRKWTHHNQQFGFPLMGALSRVHRLTNLFGEVAAVTCHSRFWKMEAEFYQACFCTAQLNFTSGLLAEVVYAKGETMWEAERKFEVHGENGGLIFNSQEGVFIDAEKSTPIEVGSRRGLFVQDTAMVLDYLFDGIPLYVTPEESLYALKVADAARRSAQLGIAIAL
ncbi:Gfo/Idh/MocA family oxidoreductase [Rivularia sp. UHCC 0363]|uniref:Gfo/Idh/MocA family protein n=1 Tax=Rivularia sp. UHCC 0363 TaxID=3110244 RepID=UPI002B1F3E71|nr:Gfo/Idh/MocA family oxidoreductase [Rivularia sp. UHCC 0363]MEA5593079.1 Gfo/Idh/MocA family oxidoreductase [Rivularia sp. UHCC 0363]